MNNEERLQAIKERAVKWGLSTVRVKPTKEDSLRALKIYDQSITDDDNILITVHNCDASIRAAEEILSLHEARKMVSRLASMEYTQPIIGDIVAMDVLRIDATSYQISAYVIVHEKQSPEELALQDAEDEQ